MVISSKALEGKRFFCVGVLYRLSIGNKNQRVDRCVPEEIALQQQQNGFGGRFHGLSLSVEVPSGSRV
jgi:hypothetical protein